LLDEAKLDLDSKNDILNKLPKRWERYGDLILFPKNSFSEDKTNDLLDEGFWMVIANALKVSKIGIQGEIRGEFRQSGARLVFGKDANVEHIENGITYSFDVTKCMFSSGNISERIRVAQFDCNGEEILDLYAGIGYYTLPLLVHSKCNHIHSCEWNKEASDSLNHNLVKNNVKDRCSVYIGDNKITIPSSSVIGNMDRVFLGLLPSSKEGWPLALLSLKDEGGMIHLHGNSPSKNEQDWAQDIIKQLSLISTSLGKNWKISLQHLEKVKWYSPHVRHVVLDILCERS
jgi:tRNA wybutosine-synthesizing protein 3